MYMIRHKTSKKVLFISYADLGADRDPKEDYSAYDKGTMEVGIIGPSGLPAEFDIKGGKVVELATEQKIAAGAAVMAPHQKLVDGQVVDMGPEELVKKGVLKLDDVKKRYKDRFSRHSFLIARALIPDHKITNAALDIYDKPRKDAYRKTIQSFRDEAERLDALVDKAKSVAEIQRITPNFPLEIADLPASDKR